MLLLFLQAAPAPVNEEVSALDRVLHAVRTVGPNLLWSLATLVIGFWIARILVAFLRRVLARRAVDRTLTSFLGNLMFMGLMTAVVIAAIDRLGVETTSFVAVLGAAGLAVGLALQGSLSNFASGVLIILFRPFKAGDTIDAAGVSGIVEEVQVFATTLRTADNKQIIVPNSAITSGNIVNYSTLPTRRVDLVFGIGYEDDLALAKSVIGRVLEADQRVLLDPVPLVAVSQLAESSVNLVVRAWVKTEHHADVTFSLTEKIKLEFDANGISIPFPQRDVHVFQAVPPALTRSSIG